MQLSSRCSKTKMCKFYLANKCDRGDECSYAHSQEELRIPPDLAGTQLCPVILEGRACKNICCRFAHSATEVKGFPGGSSRDVTLVDDVRDKTPEELTRYELFGVCLRNTFIDEDKAVDALRRTCSAPGRLISPQEYKTYIVMEKKKDSHHSAKQQAIKKRTKFAAPKKGDKMPRPLPVGQVSAISK